MIPRNAEALPEGFALKDFRIERVLRTTGFTIAYLAAEPGGRMLTLREYFPAPWARRGADGLAIVPKPGAEAAFAAGLARFRAEADALRGFHHPGLVQALDYFDAHGTGYLVSDFVAGETLASRLARDGTLAEGAIPDLLAPLLAGLEALHEAGLMHGDVQPDTIFLREGDAGAMLLDPAATRHALARVAHDDEDAATWGYAAPDEYPEEAGGEEGPWTDVYGVGATLYRCVAGVRPIGARERLREIASGAPDPLIPAARAAAGRYAAPLLDTIDAALRLDAAARPRSIAALRALLGPAAGRQAWRPLAPGLRSALTSYVPDSRRRRVYAVLAGAAALALLAIYYLTAPEGGEAGTPIAFPPPGDAALAARPGAAFRDCAACPALVVVPAGRFTMGAPDGDPDATEHERPQRTVTIARPFALGRTEVTAAEYAACAADGGCPNRGEHAPWGAGRLPAVKVEWRDAKAYAAWLSNKTGKDYRLPSEAEWEYAARAGSARRYSWGDSPGRNRANCDGCGSAWDRRQAAPAGGFPANGFGLQDMLGNVWEWTEDCWSPTLADAPADGGARPSPAACAGRVLRGGSYDLPPARMRVTSRSSADAEVGEIFIGFRVARGLAAPQR